MMRSYQSVERMRAACGLYESKIMRLLDEKQSLLDSIKKEDKKCEEEFREEMRKESQRIEKEREETYQKLKRGKDQEKNN